MYTGEILLDKNQVLAALGELPDRVSSEELIERILFIKMIESRLLETTEVSNDQVMQMLRDTRQKKLAEVNRNA